MKNTLVHTPKRAYTALKTVNEELMVFLMMMLEFVAEILLRPSRI